MGRLLRCLAVLAVLAPAATPRADGAGGFEGVVMDVTDGHPLPGAEVRLTGPALAEPRTAVSGDAGRFAFADLPAGTYALAAALEGYEPFQREGVVVAEGETARAAVWMAPAGEAPAQEVVVTGSRLRRKDLITPAPVTVIDQEQIARSGLVGLGELLQQLPEQVGGLNGQINNGSQGQVLMNLRGLDSRRTLVLVNGRRMVGGGLGGEAMVDLNTIPLAAVERIEVMKDGASAIYGSDAIAGVVNVILKKRFEGTQVSAQGGTSGRGDGQTLDLSLSSGVTGARGSSFVSIGYQEQRPVMALDRRWSSNGLTYDFTSRSVRTGGSFYTPGGSVELLTPSATCADPGSIANPQLRHVCELYQASGNPDFLWDPAAGNYRELTGDDLYNYQKEAYLVTPARRLQLFAAGNYELVKDVHAFYEASFVHRRSKRRLPATPIDLVVSGDSVYNDLGTDVFVGKRMVEAGPRRFDEEVNTFRVALGLEGDAGAWAGPLAGWHWELAYVYGRNAARDTSDGMQRQPALDAATGPSFDDGGVPTCGTPGAPIADCVPWDPMHGAGTLTDEQRRLLVFSGTAHGDQEQHVLSGDASGKLVTLWASRPAGLAVGFELRHEAGGYFPDPISAAGDAAEGNQPPVSGSYSTREAYAELSIPLLDRRPFAEDLELSAALRRVRYSTFGDNTSYKLGGRWKPVRDVTVRGTWSTAFRAPGILELYTGSAVGYYSGVDPCVAPANAAVEQQCLNEIGFLPADDGSKQVRAVQGGNTGLDPETARILTAGVVLEPRWVKGLSFTVDYWDIEIENAVDNLGASNILARCYTGEAAGNGYCARITRDPLTGRISQVDDRLTNTGKTRTSGVDLAARSVVPTRVAGAFVLRLDATYLARYDRTYPDGSVIHAAGNYDLQLLLPRWKWNATVGWQYGPFDVTTDVRYIGSLRECGSVWGESGGGLCAVYPQYSRTVRSNLVFDLAGSWERKTALGTTRVTAGVRNVLDSAPPKIFNASDNNADPGYDYIGRFVWARVSQAF
jgi:iron complex outermembrane receptor protein